MKEPCSFTSSLEDPVAAPTLDNASGSPVDSYAKLWKPTWFASVENELISYNVTKKRFHTHVRESDMHMSGFFFFFNHYKHHQPSPSSSAYNLPISHPQIAHNSRDIVGPLSGTPLLQLLAWWSSTPDNFSPPTVVSLSCDVTCLLPLQIDCLLVS